MYILRLKHATLDMHTNCAEDSVNPREACYLNRWLSPSYLCIKNVVELARSCSLQQRKRELRKSPETAVTQQKCGFVMQFTLLRDYLLTPVIIEGLLVHSRLREAP